MQVFFVGAGPGDPELITMKGQRLLAEADTIVYAGSLVNPALLDYAKPGAAIFNSASMTLAPGAKVTIYITGDVEIKNSGGVNVGGIPGDLLFYSQGDIILKNSGDLYGVFYAPDGSADLRNSADFYGAIVANDMIGHNSSKFHYDRNLGKRYKRRTGDVEVIAWREL